MIKDVSKRRLAENEAMFRAYNERVQKAVNTINAVASEQGENPFDLDETVPLHFVCECSDLSCTERIELSLKSYNEIHQERDVFTICVGHESEIVEDVVRHESGYSVVKKNVVPPEVLEAPSLADLKR